MAKEGEEVLCAICVSKVNGPDAVQEDEEGRATVKLNSCTHLYHLDCILPWFKVRNSCPQCKRAVRSFVNCAKGVTMQVLVNHERQKIVVASGEPCSVCSRLVQKEAIFQHNGQRYCYRCRPPAEYQLPGDPTSIRKASSSASFGPPTVELEIVYAVAKARSSSLSRQALLSKGAKLVQRMDAAVTADLVQKSVERRKEVMIEVASFVEELRQANFLYCFCQDTSFLSTLAFWLYPGETNAQPTSLQYALLHIVLRLLPDLDKSLVQRSKLGISVMKCWIAEANDENQRNR